MSDHLSIKTANMDDDEVLFDAEMAAQFTLNHASTHLGRLRQTFLKDVFFRLCSMLYV